MTAADLHDRLAEHWRRIDDHDEASFGVQLETLLDGLAVDDPLALFERGAAFDSFGHPDLAVPLYRRALDGGIAGERRRRATIQMASSLRNLGHPQQAVDLLSDELARPPDHLTGAVRAVLALALVDVGREREAVSVALVALAEYLPRYNRSMARYARALVDGSS